MTMNLISHNISRPMKPQPISSSASIQSLPHEVLLNIFSYLSLGDICNTVAKVCKDWENIHWDPELYSLSITLKGEKTLEQLLTCLKDAKNLASPYYDSESIRNVIAKSLKNHNEMKWMKTGKNPFVYKFDKDLIKVLSHLRQVTLILLTNVSSNKAVMSLLSCCVQLEELKLYGDPHVSVFVRNPELIALCKKLCGTLRILHVDCVDWTLNAVKAIAKCRLLDDLAIRESNHLPTESLLVIARMSTLRRLQIDHCCRPDASDWICMFSNDNLKYLTCLHLEVCSYNDDVVVAIGTNLKNLAELTMITLLSSQPSVKRYEANKGLDAIIKGCNKLTRLELCFVGSEGQQLAKTLLLIPEYLPWLKRLTTIGVAHTSLKWKNELKKKMPDLLIRARLCEEFQ